MVSTHGARPPLWLLAAMACMCALGFLALNYENSFVLHAPTALRHVPMAATATTSAPLTVLVEKIVVQETIVEKIKIIHDEVPSAGHGFSARDGDNTTVHIVYVTRCVEPNRQLFSATLQLSASRAAHYGPMTEVISGCSQDQVAEIARLPTFYTDYHVHFAPAFPAAVQPFGLRHFLQEADRAAAVRGNMPIALVPLDFVFFLPLRVNTGINLTRFSRQGPIVVSDTVTDGAALAQDLPRHDTDTSEFGGGLPYILTKHDALRVIDDVCDDAAAASVIDDMGAYGRAAANHGVRHTLLTHLAPPIPESNWTWLVGDNDASMANPCDETSLDVVLPRHPPIALHYNQPYETTTDKRWRFDQALLPEDILACDAMMLRGPPPTLWTDVQGSDPALRQSVWAACTMGKITNHVLLAVKERQCPLGFNTFQGMFMDEGRKRESALATKKDANM
ncbi:Aste57867_13136 [Aphanomyces stellatus]|uniref:Aste57867_13136 protein n=1 Tax=Aphanomyces stellatus TaxID=120398 RepID=A0A485KY84_9STRA|nr:hypothetical protein As57867_013087 [Aphanomyces stellatus]VFT89978.1 Aste57867_13136 [Aphanomyces stellatus]